MQNIDHTPAASVRPEPVMDIQGRLAKELIRPLLFQSQQPAQNTVDALSGQISVLRSIFLVILSHMV